MQATSLFHAGPPLVDPARPPAPLLNSICGAIVLEGWAASFETALEVFHAGQIRLASAQDFGIVTPLAFVAGPSTICLKVSDLTRPERFKVSPLNDGPPPDALRFGTYKPAGLAIVRELMDETGDALAGAMRAPLPLLPAMAAAVANGDELHGRVSAMQERVLSAFDPLSSNAAKSYMASAGQFALNIVMAAAALMIGAGGDVAGSNMVTACGGNGETLGFKLGGEDCEWQCLPSSPPIGPKLPVCEGRSALRAIGDSAVIDALGFGAACLRYCPELAGALKHHFESGELSAAFLDKRASENFLGPHPALNDKSIRLGLDISRAQSSDCLGIMLGMVDETGEHGLIGRGIAPWWSADHALLNSVECDSHL